MSSKNRALAQWVQQTADHATPASVHWCTGSDDEYRSLIDGMVEAKTLIPLDPSTHPRSYLHRSDSTDVARTSWAASTEECTRTRDFLAKFADRTPRELLVECAALRARLART